jgi:peptidoglycan/xylan/chitin deacetylase (PgdA/CDA1 family)
MRSRLLPRALAAGALVLVVVAAVALAAHRGSPATPRAAAPRATATVAASQRARRRRARGLPAAPADLRGAAARGTAVPILMYHVVSAAPAGTANAQLWVARGRFAAEMHALQRAGYHAVTLRAVYDAWHRGGPLPRKPVVVSFDDGYLSQYTHAAPVLKALGWPGVLNLIVHSIGPGGLTEHQVRSLMAAGWELDSHTVTHPDLTTLGDAQLRREVSDSRRDLQQRFGVPVDFFCYPSGKFDARVVAAVRAAGYLAATTTNPGYARPGGARLELPRVRVNASDTAATLLARLVAERPV